MVCTCRLIWQLAWLIGVWISLAILLFLALEWYPEVVINEAGGSSKQLVLPFQPRRPPIPIQVIPDCYFILSDIRLKMSFLLLFKTLFDAETLAAERLRVLCSRTDPEWLVVSLGLCMLLALCLLLKKPPDRLLELQDFVVEVKTPRRWLSRFLHRLLQLLLLLIGVCFWASKSAPQDLQALDRCIASVSSLGEDKQDPLSSVCLRPSWQSSTKNRRPGRWVLGTLTLSQSSWIRVRQNQLHQPSAI